MPVECVSIAQVFPFTRFALVVVFFFFFFFLLILVSLVSL